MLSLENFPWLTFIIAFPILMSLLVAFVPDKGDGKTIRWFSLVVGLIDFAAIAYAFCTKYDYS
ncbi:MAG: NAD(P)H-quinone oxidoreductase subunit 4, partial [Pseudanabaena sp.]